MTFGSLRKGTGVALLAGALAGSCTGFGGSGPPDVVLIVVDTLRADHLTQYGYGRETSSALAEFSSAATRFSNAYSTSSWTQPAVSSLLTGLLPSRHGVVKQSTKLPAELASLPSTLSEAGWQTAGFSGNLFIGEKTAFDRGFEHFQGHGGKVLVYPDIADMIAKVDFWQADVWDHGRPVFLYFQPMNCHGPYRVPAEHRKDLLGYDPDRTFDYNDSVMTAILKDGDIEARDRVTPEYLESLTDQYDTAVRYSMDAVAALLATLKKEGIYDDALVIVTSDHGEELFEHGGFGHAYSLFEEVVRIPLWIKLPGQREGSVVDAPVSLIDLMPTILDAAGLPALEGLDGLSLAPLLEDGSAPGFRGRPIVADTRWKRRAVATAVRLGSYKLIEIESDYSGRADERLLFDLEADPAELVDLAVSEPEKAAALSQALERTLALDGSSIETEAATGLDLDVLRALGYVD
ncbi:MAG: sulfatase [Thermoanaerobaculia bacterium]